MNLTEKEQKKLLTRAMEGAYFFGVVVGLLSGIVLTLLILSIGF
jgi:hypothetical protein